MLFGFAAERLSVTVVTGFKRPFSAADVVFSVDAGLIYHAFGQAFVLYRAVVRLSAVACAWSA